MRHGYVDNVLSTPTQANVKGRLNTSARKTRGGMVEKTVHAQGQSARPSQAGLSRSSMKLVQQKSYVKMIVVALVCVLAVVGIGVGVASMVFLGGLDSKLALTENQGTQVAADESTVADVLVSAGDSAGYYTLVAADLDGQGDAGLGDGPDVVALVYTNPQTKAATLLLVPAETQVSLQDARTHQLRDAYNQDGTAAFIADVANLTGAKISHFVYTDSQGLINLVDALGGINATLTEEVDDPAAGTDYVAAGEQTLTGRQALTVARASNYEGGRSAQAANCMALAAGIAEKLMGAGTLDLFMNLDKISGLSTDVSAWGAASIADSMRGFKPDALQSAALDGYETTSDNTTYFVLSQSDVATMLSRVQSGQAPVEEVQKVVVDPQSFTITIRNGGGVTGAAASVAELLAAQNYKVEETGNTDTQAYDDTLVVYNDAQFADAAQSLVDLLGVGRTVQSNGSYTFETDVLLILGKDYAQVV